MYETLINVDFIIIFNICMLIKINRCSINSNTFLILKMAKLIWAYKPFHKEFHVILLGISYPVKFCTLG